MGKYLASARLDCKYGRNEVILCSLPSAKSNVALNDSVIVSNSEIYCSSWGLFPGRGGYEFAFQF